MTEVAVRYIRETNNAKKQELLLELVRFFHSYTFKYVSMVVSGTVPKTGNVINKDVKLFLRRFVPAGTAKITSLTLAKVARTLNIAFKGQTVDEVYNILAGCLIRALDKYDPDYTKKVREVVIAIDQLTLVQFTSKQVSNLVGFNASKICKMLVKRGHLKKVVNPERPKSKYMAKDVWPVDDKLMNTKPIGLPYFVSDYFRQYLQQYITDEINTLEPRNAIMQLNCSSASLFGFGSRPSTAACFRTALRARFCPFPKGPGP